MFKNLDLGNVSYRNKAQTEEKFAKFKTISNFLKTH